MRKHTTDIFLKTIFYASILALLLYLYRIRLVQFYFDRVDIGLLLLAVVFVCAGFLVNALFWMRLLHLFKINVSYSLSLWSLGRTIFAKYIPGKIWLLVGRAVAIAGQQYPKERVMWASAFAQIISLWIGGLAGMFFCISYGSENLQVWATVFVVITGILIFSYSLQKKILSLIGKLMRREYKIYCFPLRDLLVVVGICISTWILWSTGFVFLLKAFLGNKEVPIAAFLIFPSAAIAGIAALVAPGGLGVREAIMGGLLALSGISLAHSATISIVARFWFLVGEFFIFICSFIWERMGSHEVEKCDYQVNGQFRRAESKGKQ